MKQKPVFLIATITFILFACTSQPDLPSPEKLGELQRVKVNVGDEAAGNINQLHGLEVAPKSNAIVEYGEQDPDLLYISLFETSEEAGKTFEAMIEKMGQSESGIFQHLMPMRKYNEKVYMTLGMGAIHYIYSSGKYVLWLQTKQRFGMELPQELLNIYPLAH